MFFCLRVDLDYVPWDSPDAEEFGHGEPAVLLRLLEAARDGGYRLHFFIANRTLRAFPTTAKAALDEGHDIDWLCKHPETPHARFSEIRDAMATLGHELQGLAVKNEWPHGASSPSPDLKFISAKTGESPSQIRLFPAYPRSDREAIQGGITPKKWVDDIKAALRLNASRNVGTTVCVRPQVLAKFDPRLTHVRELLDFSAAIGLRVCTLRDALLILP